MKYSLLLLLLFFVVSKGQSEDPPQCGPDAGGKLCQVGMCCSRWGHCGETDAYCNANDCQSQCPISNIMSEKQFEEMLKYRDHPLCPARKFYTYKAFVDAAKFLPRFANVGNNSTKMRDIAAFLAQTSFETAVVLPSILENRYVWGYCINAKHSSEDYCIPDDRWPCVPGKKYYPRGPFQIAYNIIYGQVGQLLGLDLLSNPDLVETDPVVSFATAILYWIANQPSRPSCHDVMAEKWEPSYEDLLAERLPGFGLTTNILNGPAECGKGEPNANGEDRIGFYKRYCDILGIAYGDYLDCYNQQPFVIPSTVASARVLRTMDGISIS